MRRQRVILVLAVLGAGLWLAFGKDATRDKVVHALGELSGQARSSRTAAASWGDVARKIGDFEAEERGLRDSVNRAEAAQPPQQQP
jgi:hypothetical protein